jgi:hypothetical protein
MNKPQISRYHSTFIFVPSFRGVVAQFDEWGEGVTIRIFEPGIERPESCYKSVHKLSSVDKLCSHCLFLVVVTSLQQTVINNL